MISTCNHESQCLKLPVTVLRRLLCDPQCLHGKYGNIITANYYDYGIAFKTTEVMLYTLQYIHVSGVYKRDVEDWEKLIATIHILFSLLLSFFIPCSWQCMCIHEIVYVYVAWFLQLLLFLCLCGVLLTGIASSIITTYHSVLSPWGFVEDSTVVCSFTWASWVSSFWLWASCWW